MNDETKNLSPFDILDCTFDKPKPPLNPRRVVQTMKIIDALNPYTKKFDKEYLSVDHFIEKYRSFSHHDLLNLNSGAEDNNEKVAGLVTNLRNMGQIKLAMIEGVLPNFYIHISIKSDVDDLAIGDFIGVEGSPFRSDKKILGLLASKIVVLTKGDGSLYKAEQD